MNWLLIYFLGLGCVFEAASLGGNRLLLLLEESTEKSKYSNYITDLEDRGYQISIDSPKNEKLSLSKLDDRTYDHLLILPCKSKGLGPNLTPAILLDFLNQGGNIFIALSATRPTPTSLVSLLLELDIHLPTDRSSVIIDHFNYDTHSSAEMHDVLLVPRPDAIRPDVKNYFRGSGIGGEVIAVPRAVGQTLGNLSPLLTPILRAPRTAYSYSTKDEVLQDIFAVGPQLSLVTAFQARNSARCTVIGSSEMLEDAWFDRKVARPNQSSGTESSFSEASTINRVFAKEITGWTFKEIGALQVGTVEHHLKEESSNNNGTNSKIYRVKNDVTYKIELSEYSWGKWIPFVPAHGDVVQLEFSMLSPFHRLPLRAVSTSKNSTIFSTSFRLPDQHGIFNFMVNYKRPFLTNVEEKDTVTVRHFAHDEWPRSWVITGAWPWIAGIGATIIGWLVFIALWLWSKPVLLEPKEILKKKQ